MTQTGLEAFIPLARSIEINGQAFVLAPLSIGKLHRVLREIQDALPSLMQGDILGAIAEFYPEMRRGLAVAMDQADAWFDAVSPEAFIEAVLLLVEVNTDFFARRLLPYLEQAFQAERMQKPDGAGYLHFLHSTATQLRPS